MLTPLTETYLPSLAAEDMALRQQLRNPAREVSAETDESDSGGVKLSLSPEAADLLQPVGGESPAIVAAAENEGHDGDYYSSGERERATRKSNVSARLSAEGGGDAGVRQLARMLQSVYGGTASVRGNIHFEA